MADTSKITLGQLKTALTQAKNYTDNEIAGITGVSKVEPEELDMPKVFFNGDKPTTKTSVYATIEYISKTEHFKGYVDIKCQGTSSMSYPKKNYTIKMFTDETMVTKLKKDFKGWGKQSKFCLKANYIDHSHARNIVSAKLWGQVVKSRSDFDSLPEELKTSPNYGAVEGFPIKVYYNNTYEGVYTWNIPKDGWMNNMDDSLDTHCILCGEEYVSGCFRSANASLWSDELHDVMPANIVTSFNNFQNFVINSSDDEFKTGLSTYADINSLIDYYIFQYVICGLDSMGKNQLFFTYDGIKWMASSYDMDSTFGMYWNGQSFVSATYRMQEDYESMKSGRQGNLLYIRMEQLFCQEIKARYAELRAKVLSYSNIVNEFERFMDTIGKDLYAEDLTIYTGIPSGSTNNIQQIRNYTRDRLTYVDTQIEALTLKIPCTGIVISNDSLSFTTIDTQTLEVVVSPPDTTDTVVWSVEPSGVVSVDNGVVTPIANGACTITATCGSYTDTCSVTVSLPTVECTNITLDKTELALGTGANVSDEGKNYLENVEWALGSVTGNGVNTNTRDYACQLTNLPVGTYTLHHDTYTYKKVRISDNGISLEGSKTAGSNNAADITFNITNPNLVVDISAFSNSDIPNGVILSRTNIPDIQEYSAEYTTVSSPSWGFNVNPDYITLEITVGNSTDVDKNKIINVCIGDDKYYISNVGTVNASILNTLSDKCGITVYAGNVIADVAVPKSKYGSTLDEFKSYCSNNGITNIYVNKDIQSTSGISSAQLTATVTPTNCTQPVVWSVSPEGIVTVDNGLVTAVANGEATVTATCGTQTATCNVTVN